MPPHLPLSCSDRLTRRQFLGAGLSLGAFLLPGAAAGVVWLTTDQPDRLSSRPRM